MTNIRYPIEEYRDIETLNFYREQTAKGRPQSRIMESIYVKSRDNARTPMQWADAPYAGFSESEPWIQVNPNYREINAQAQVHDTESIFHYYRKLIALRKQYEVFLDGRFELLCPEDPDIFAYKRWNEQESLYVVCNFGAVEVASPLELDMEGMQCLISNYPTPPQNKILRPYEAFMCLTKNSFRSN